MQRPRTLVVSCIKRRFSSAVASTGAPGGKDEFLDNLLLDQFDDAVSDAGSVGIIETGRGSGLGGPRGFGARTPPPRTSRYILDDYRKSFQHAQTSSKTIRKPTPLQYAEDDLSSSVLVDDRPRRQPAFELDVDGASDVTTPDAWLSKFSSPNEDNQWIMRFIANSRVSNMTAKGKTPSIKSLIVIGNTQGSAGFGVGKGPTMQVANNRAIVNAKNNLVWLDFKDGRGIYEPLIGKHNNTKAMFWPRPDGAGHRVGGIMRAVCECFGLMDVTGKIVGRNNPYSVIQAIFNSFQNMRTEEQVALARGRRIVDIQNINPKYSRDPFQ